MLKVKNKILSTGILVYPLLLNSCSENNPKQYNVLLIVVDDLRPELGCYGKQEIISPNIDRLASEATVFTRAYCNVPVSGASRASFLSGTRPGRKRYLGYDTWLDKDNPGAQTIPGCFRNNGYYTVSNSKVFHHPGEGRGSWDEEWRNKIQFSWRNYALQESREKENAGRGPAWECADVTDTAYYDGETAEKTISDLKRLKGMKKPFFLATGFYKPHLPFTAPKKYWDLYDRQKIKLAGNPNKPDAVPDAAIHTFQELRYYDPIPQTGPVPDSIARILRQGYYACISYTDAQVGKVLNALKDLGLDKNTLIVIMGDHGWNLGEHGLWCKHCNFETSLHVPLIIKVPGVTKGEKAGAIAEFVDLFPTLCDLCGIIVPEQCEGVSLAPVLRNSQGNTDGFAISKYYDGITYIKGNLFYTEYMDSVRTYGAMLFEHNIDPDENKNLLIDEVYSKKVGELKSELMMHYFKGE